MYKLYPYFTNDGSVGLFSPDADDIYHSTYGALTEAYEKFILPADLVNYFQKNNEIKILDICFGIGYNSKSFFDFFLKKILNENFNQKNSNIASIHTDKNKYNEKIYTDKILHKKNIKTEHVEVDKNEIILDTKKIRPQKYKIFIRAVDTDKNLAFLSPFFVTGEKKLKNEKIAFSQEKIMKMLKKSKNSKLRLNDEINIIFLHKIIKNHPEILTDPEISKILNDKNYVHYFDTHIRRLFEFYRICKGNYNPFKKLTAFLHNIYYLYISSSYKKALKALKMVDFKFDLKIEDARLALLSDLNRYNYIFLDAFTPAKCPCLWTIDFFKLLYEHLDPDGMILTYSNAASIRNAFINAGFYVGKIFNPTSNKFMGTVAVKNKSLVKYELSEYDFGLLNTKAGIFYRDENLNASNEAIIEAHKKEFENSDLISSSKFIKLYKLNKK